MEVYSTDVLILGGGISAYMAAYTMMKKRKKDEVMLITPRRGGEAAHELTGMALPRMAGGDTISQYTQDTLTAGDGQNDPSLVRPLCEESAQVFDRVRTIMEFDLPEEGARFRPVTGDKTALWKELSDTVSKHAEIKEGCHALRLLIRDGRVQGALCYDEPKRAFFAVSAGTVVLATGGYGDLYRENADAKSLRNGSSGIGLAYYAGAELADLEFTDFGEKGVTTLGGVVIDNQCRTAIPGLLACGGVTAGIHGAGLLDGNAETAALVYGRRAGHALGRMDFLSGADEETIYKWVNETVYIGQKDQSAAYARIRQEIAHTLNASAGEIRTQEKIEDGLRIIAHLQHELNDLDLCPLHQVYEKMELEFALIAARLTLLASLEREECCGCYKRAVIHLVEKPEQESVQEQQPAEYDEPEAAGEASSEGTDEESADEETAVVCPPPREPEYEEQVELIEKQVNPYRVIMQLDHDILSLSRRMM